MSAQIARLYLRGTLITKTMKNLNEKQKDEIETIVKTVLKDPNLNHVKTEFCGALARTIANEYKDRQLAEQDYAIAITRAAVAARHGYNDKPPSPKAINEPIQRKKWFQTWAFNYLKQILLENKLPSVTRKEKISLSADQAAIHEIKALLQRTIRKTKDLNLRRQLKKYLEVAIIEEQPHKIALKIHHWDFPIQEQLAKLTNKYLNHGITIQVVEDAIEAVCQREDVPSVEVTQQKKTLIQTASIDVDPDDQQRHRNPLEEKAMTTAQMQPEVEQSELLTTLYNKVPDDVRPILQIYYEESRPQDYRDQYGEGTPRLAHIAKYLGKTTKEVKKLIGVLKLYCLAIGLGA